MTTSTDDVAALVARLEARAKYVRAFPTATVHQESVPPLLDEAAAALTALAQERDAARIRTISEDSWTRARDCAIGVIEKYAAQDLIGTKDERAKAVSDAFQHAVGLLSIAPDTLIRAQLEEMKREGDALGKEAPFCVSSMSTDADSLNVLRLHLDVDSRRGDVREYMLALINSPHVIAALQRFKDFVHRCLDEMGVPTHPDGPHSAAGCRIGDRLDIVQGWRARLQEAEKELEWRRADAERAQASEALLLRAITERDALLQRAREGSDEVHSRIDNVTVAADRMQRQGYDEPLLSRILDEAAEARGLVCTLSREIAAIDAATGAHGDGGKDGSEKP